MQQGWIRVTREHPCPCCSKSDFCTRSADGTLARCCRIESTWPSTNSLGTAWIHKLSEPLPQRDAPVREHVREDWTSEARKCWEHPDAKAARAALAIALEVSEKSLELLRVGYGKDYSGEWTAWPERDGGGRIVGITRRYQDGEKKAMPGCSHGLFYDMQWMSRRGPVWVVEGGSDTAACITANLCAIGRPSNSGGVQDLAEMLECFKAKDVVVVGERDRKPERVGAVSSCPADCPGCAWCWPGRSGAITVAQGLAKRLKRKVSWILPDPGVKDIRDWLACAGIVGLRAALSRRLAGYRAEVE